MSCTQGTVIVRSSSRISPVNVIPALTPSTTTTATESFGSCNTQWIILHSSVHRSEVEHRLRYRREAFAMCGARSVSRQRGQVLRRSVALVVTEAVVRIHAVKLVQHRIARGLGDDRRRRNHPDVAIALDDRARSAREFRAAIAVDPRFA